MAVGEWDGVGGVERSVPVPRTRSVPILLFEQGLKPILRTGTDLETALKV